MKVWVVSTRGYEGEFEPVAVFSSSEKAYEFIKQKEFRSWSVDDLTIDNQGGVMKGTTLTERDADILILTKKLLELEELQSKRPTDEKDIVIKAIAYRIRHISMGGI